MLSLAQALAALPNTADGIADHLTERGIRGVPADSYCCVLANYLIAEGFTGAMVGDFRIETNDVHGDFEDADTPKPVADFLKRFDGHAWPELVADA